MSATTSPATSPARSRSAPRVSSRAGAAWYPEPRASVCASARPRRWSTVAGPAARSGSRVGPIDAAGVIGQLAAAPPKPASYRSLPQAGQPGLRLLARIGAVDPSLAGRLPSRRRLRGLAEGHRDGGAGRHRRDHRLEARRPWRAAFPTGRKWAAVARQLAQPALPGLQRRRVRAGHVQGSRPRWRATRSPSSRR